MRSAFSSLNPFITIFIPTAEDATRLSRLTHELDNRALHCLGVSTCEDMHYARALISLFENQEAAGASFRRVIKGNPAMVLAASSRLWLQLIENDEMLIKATPNTKRSAIEASCCISQAAYSTSMTDRVWPLSEITLFSEHSKCDKGHDSSALRRTNPFSVYVVVLSCPLLYSNHVPHFPFHTPLCPYTRPRNCHRGLSHYHTLYKHTFPPHDAVPCRPRQESKELGQRRPALYMRDIYGWSSS